MSPIMTQHGLDAGFHSSLFSLYGVCKPTSLGLVVASLVGLTGCATSAEVESLRAELARVNATAVRAEAEVARTQRELAVLKAAATTPRTSATPRTTPSAPSTKPGGYKWGTLPQY